jgi:hypothetical protein
MARSSSEENLRQKPSNSGSSKAFGFSTSTLSTHKTLRRSGSENDLHFQIERAFSAAQQCPPTEHIPQDATAWLNLLLARDINVLAVVTHADCVSTDILE